MKIKILFSLLILLIRIRKIFNETYDFRNFSNLKCNNTSYKTSFTADVCGKTKINSDLYFSFIISDTKQKNHNIKCSVIIPIFSRVLEDTDDLYSDNTDEEYNSEIITDLNDETDSQTYKEEEKTDKQAYIDPKTDDYVSDGTDIDTVYFNDTDIGTDTIEKSTTNIQSDTSIEETDIILTTSLETDKTIYTDSDINQISSTYINNESTTPKTTIPTNENESTIPESELKTSILMTELETNIPTTIIKTTIPFTSNIYTTINNKEQTTIIKTLTTQIRNNEYTSIVTDYSTQHEIINEDYYCYETICLFQEEIKEDFEVIIEPNLYTFENVPDGIGIQSNISETKSYTINKCYLVKNIYKQVLKYKINESEKKITFLFVSKIISKVEKNEQIEAVIHLKNKDSSIETNNATCYSKYELEPVEGEDILTVYNCEVSNISQPSQYSGLLFISSVDVNNIPENSDLKDPAITDELIKKGEIIDLTIPVFNSISIDISECENSGIFYIKGKLTGVFDSINYLPLYLYLNESKAMYATCSIPGAIWKEINFTCKVDNNFYNSRILVPQSIVRNVNINETLLNITNVASEKEATCIISQVNTDIITTMSEEIVTDYVLVSDSIEIIPDTIEIIPDTIVIPKNIDTDLVFRQINHFEKDYTSNIIKFNLIGFTFNDLYENSYLEINIKLIRQNMDNETKNAKCFLNSNIYVDLSNLTPLIFECEINNISNITLVNDIQIVSSPFIKNIQTNYLSFTYANITDSLIQQGTLKDYSEINNLNKIPPLISDSSINAENCKDDGIFSIKGFVNAPIQKSLYFYIELKNPSTKVRCLTPSTKENSSIDIKCYTTEKIENSTIEVDSLMVYDIKYNELFYINSTEADNIDCGNNKEINLKKALKKIEAINIFRQVCKFSKENNKYKFFLSTFINKRIDYNMRIKIIVEIKRGINEKNSVSKALKKRKLSDNEIKNAECSPKIITNFFENNIGAACWECITETSSINNAIGLNIIESDEISGIPDNSELIDPAKTDLLIEKGEMLDYTIEENLNELLPIFNILTLNFSFCKENGTFNFEGESTSTILNNIIFNLSLAYPEAIFACSLPKAYKGKNAIIECYNRDNFENESLLVEETVIREGYNEYIILRNSTSGVSYVTCSSTENQITGSSYDTDIKIVSRTYENGSSSGIGKTGIIIIIVVGIVVFIGIVTLIIFIIRKNKKKKVTQNEQKMMNSSASSFGSSSSPSYY